MIDICDLSSFDDHSFDKVICYGGPLSYVFEKNIDALKEIHRVLKPGGLVLLSVMNLWGTLNQSLMTIIFSFSEADNEKIITTGNLHPSSYADSAHYCHMYKSQELTELLENTGFEIVEISASNCLATNRGKELEEIEKNPQKWQYFLDLEIQACKSSGMIESGSHLIVIAKTI